MQHINVNDQGAITLAMNAEYYARTKYIDIQYHFVREHIEKQSITLAYCPTSDMTEDIYLQKRYLTRPLRSTILH